MGFMILDAWAQASNISFETKRYGDMTEISVKGRTFHLLKPSTYMNLSGNAVRYWLRELDIPMENLVVVCDDINLPFGAIRMRGSGSDGGHNGLKNIQELLETQSYARIRLGVGHDFQQGGQIDFVLGELSEDERGMIPEISSKVIAGIRDWAFVGLQKAMTELNRKEKKTDKSASI